MLSLSVIMGSGNSGDGERWALLREGLPYFWGLGMSWPEEVSNGFRSGTELLPPAGVLLRTVARASVCFLTPITLSTG